MSNLEERIKRLETQIKDHGSLDHYYIKDDISHFKDNFREHKHCKKCRRPIVRTLINSIEYKVSVCTNCMIDDFYNRSKKSKK